MAVNSEEEKSEKHTSAHVKSSADLFTQQIHTFLDFLELWCHLELQLTLVCCI